MTALFRAHCTQLDVEDTRLVVTTLGEPTDLPPVVVHHGAPGLVAHAQSLEAFGFLARSRQVVTFDAAGSGETPAPPGGVSNDAWVRHLSAVVQWAGPPAPVVAGISYGGFIALQYAVTAGEGLPALILSGTSPHGGLTQRALQEIDRRGASLDRASAVRFLDGQVRDEDDLRHCADVLRPLYSRPGVRTEPRPTVPTRLNAATHNHAMAIGQHAHDVLAELPGITAPTLVLVGRHDWITPEAHSRQMAAVLPDARLEVFDDSGHSPFRDEPGRFRAAVQAFLALRVDRAHQELH
jgi:proline iminopeptidase